MRSIFKPQSLVTSTVDIVKQNPGMAAKASSVFTRTTALAICLILNGYSSAAEFDLDDFERKVDSTLRSACHGYAIDMLPDFLSEVRTWLYEESPVCAEVEQLQRDEPLRNVFARLPMSQNDVDRIYDRDAWTRLSGSGEVAANIGFSCEMEYMCLNIRRGLAETSNPVSQTDYDLVAQSCADAPSPYFCIENWFSTWPRPLPTPAPLEVAVGPGALLDQLLIGADEAIDENRAIAARELEQAEEIARLELQRTAILAAMEEEKTRLIAEAERRQRDAQAAQQERNLLGIGIALAGGALLASQSGFTDAGKLDFLTEYVSGVINQQDIESFQRDLGGVATDELVRQNEQLKRIEAEQARVQAAREASQAETRRTFDTNAQHNTQSTVAQAGTTPGASTQPLAPSPTDLTSRDTSSTSCTISRSGPGGVPVGPPSLIDARYLGRYIFDNNPNDYWELNSDGSGTWSTSYGDGSAERVAINWVPMVDKLCGAQVANRGDVEGFMLVVEYAESLSDRKRNGLRFASRELNHNQLRVGCTNDGRGCEANFGGYINVWYSKQ